MRLITSFKLILASVALALGVTTMVSAPVFAQKQAVCEGIGIAGGDCNAGAGNTQVNNLVRTVINILSLLGGIAAVIIIIISGFRLIVSGGDADGLKNARNGVLYAIIGLIIIAFAQVIVRFVLGRL